MVEQPWTGRDVEGRCRVLICGNITEFAWKDWGKYRRNFSMIVNVPAEIRIGHFSYTSQKRYTATQEEEEAGGRASWSFECQVWLHMYIRDLQYKQYCNGICVCQWKTDTNIHRAAFTLSSTRKLNKPSNMRDSNQTRMCNQFRDTGFPLEVGIHCLKYFFWGGARLTLSKQPYGRKVLCVQRVLVMVTFVPIVKLELEFSSFLPWRNNLPH
jgi:hypothetical protein